MGKEEDLATAAAAAGVAKSAPPVVVSGMTLAGYSLNAGGHADVDSGSDGLVHLVEHHQAASPAGRCRVSNVRVGITALTLRVCS